MPDRYYYADLDDEEEHLYANFEELNRQLEQASGPVDEKSEYLCFWLIYVFVIWGRQNPRADQNLEEREMEHKKCVQ